MRHLQQYHVHTTITTHAFYLRFLIFKGDVTREDMAIFKRTRHVWMTTSMIKHLYVTRDKRGQTRQPLWRIRVVPYLPNLGQIGYHFQAYESYAWSPPCANQWNGQALQWSTQHQSLLLSSYLPTVSHCIAGKERQGKERSAFPLFALPGPSRVSTIIFRWLTEITVTLTSSESLVRNEVRAMLVKSSRSPMMSGRATLKDSKNSNTLSLAKSYPSAITRGCRPYYRTEDEIELNVKYVIRTRRDDCLYWSSCTSAR